MRIFFVVVFSSLISKFQRRILKAIDLLFTNLIALLICLFIGHVFNVKQFLLNDIYLTKSKYRKIYLCAKRFHFGIGIEIKIEKKKSNWSRSEKCTLAIRWSFIMTLLKHSLRQEITGTFIANKTEQLRNSGPVAFSASFHHNNNCTLCSDVERFVCLKRNC